MGTKTEKATRDLTPRQSLLMLIALAGFIGFAGLYLKLPTRLTLLLAVFLTSVACMALGHSAKQVEQYIIAGIKKCGFLIAILMVIGCVIGSWIVAGIIPSIIYYGLEILTPTTFLIGGLISCSLVSYFTGSTYACIGTIGVALMGIGQGLGLPLPLTAGLVLSGAVFGDKMSPFSDTTNLAAGSAGTPLFSHIHSMLYSTIPAWLIAAALFLYFGTSSINGSVDVEKIDALQKVIQNNFTISPFLLLVPLLTIGLAVKNLPTIISMSFGVVIGIVTALIFQSHFGANTILSSLIGGLDYDFGTAEVNKLFANRGGLASMLFTISIVVLALVLGELFIRLGMLKGLIKGAEKLIVNTATLVIATIFSSIVTVMISASQYLAIILPGEALKPLYKKRGVSRKVLSRSLEDGGTIFSTLVPWSADAIFVASALGVATLEYLPFAFFSLLCPIISIIYALIGFAIWDDKNDVDVDMNDEGALAS